jgi:signal transduction histidine kinase
VADIARALRVALVLLAILCTALSVALILGRAGWRTTYGDARPWLATLELAAGFMLAVGGVALVSVRRGAVPGGLAIATAIAWFAPVWIGWDPGGPALIRAVGLFLAPLLPLPVLLLVVTLRAPRRAMRIGAVAGSAALVIVVTARTLVRDPLLDRYCWSNCRTDLLVLHADPILARHLTELALGLWIALGIAVTLIALGVGAWSGAVIRRGANFALFAAAAVGAAIAASGVGLLLEPAESPGSAFHRALFTVRALTLVALALGLGWLWLQPRVVRAKLAGLAMDVERTAQRGGLRKALADALDEPGLRIAYPVGGDTDLVDAEGLAVTAWPIESVPVVADGQTIAKIAGFQAVVDPAVVEQAIGPAAQLALGNERLRAESLARLTEVSASRRRVVEAGDASRRKLERDLHDGAQQQLLALTFDLYAAAKQAEAAGRAATAALLRVALDQSARATEEVRDLANGIFPAALAASGLESAVENLADTRPLHLSVELEPGRRYPAAIEAAAYAVVSEGVAAADELARISVAERDGSLAVSVEGAVWGPRLAAVEDRVGAVGGSVTFVDRRLEVRLPLVPPA